MRRRRRCHLPSGSGSGNINATVGLPVGGTTTFTVPVPSPRGATGSLSNTAHGVGRRASPTRLGQQHGHRHRHADAAGRPVHHQDRRRHHEAAGHAGTYTIVVSNAGPSAVTGASVTDTVPATHHRCDVDVHRARRGSACPASGTGDISASVSLLAGGTRTFTLTGNRSLPPDRLADQHRHGRRRPAAPPTRPGQQQRHRHRHPDAAADLSITKTDGVTSAVPGTPTTYTIVVTQRRPQRRHRGDRVRPPAGRRHRATWTLRRRRRRQRAGRQRHAATWPPPSTCRSAPPSPSPSRSRSAPPPPASLVNTATVTPPAGGDRPEPGQQHAPPTPTP